MSDFEFAAASVTGRDHLGRNGVLLGKNNQDAVAWKENTKGVVAVICDGCSEGAHSEVGSKLAVRWLLNRISARLETSEDDIWWYSFFESLHAEASEWLRKQAEYLSEEAENRFRVLKDYLLFTTVGVIMHKEELVFFSIGDGVYGVNEKTVTLGPFEKNEPPYLLYTLSDKLAQKYPQCRHFFYEVMPLAGIQDFFIGSDGVCHLIAAEGKKLPGSDETVGKLHDLLLQDAVFRNPDKLRRSLVIINREVAKPFADRVGLNFETGLLADDTTLFVARRRYEKEELNVT